MSHTLATPGCVLSDLGLLQDYLNIYCKFGAESLIGGLKGDDPLDRNRFTKLC